MVLTPETSAGFVIYCRGQRVQVLTEEDLDKAEDERQPVIELTAPEAHMLTGFLAYWLFHERKWLEFPGRLGVAAKLAY